MTTAHVHHTHLMASDVEATVRFWTECFDADVVADTTMAGVRNIMLEVGGGRLNLYDQPPNHRGVVNHIGVQVTDLEQTVARLEAAGWQPRPAKVDGSLRYVMVQGPDGLLLEVFHVDRGTTPGHLRRFFTSPVLPDHVDEGGPAADVAGHRKKGKTAPPTGPGAGDLSPEATERLNRPSPEPLRPPPVDDHRAVARWRDEIHRAWLDGDPSAADLDHDEVEVAGVRCLASGRSDGPVMVVYVHGGGFCLGSPEVALPITAGLLGIGTDRAARTGPPAAMDRRSQTSFGLISVDYRLAPEHRFPAAIDDVVDVVSHIGSDGTGGTGRSIVLAGDSAGANIALAAAIRLRDTAPVAGLVLFSPHLDLTIGHASSSGAGIDDPRSDVDEEAGGWLRGAYCGHLDPEDPLISPIRDDLRQLPPMLIQVGTRDATYLDAVRLNRKARAAGVDSTLDVWEGLWHTWHYHRDLPEAWHALAEARGFIGRLGGR